MFEWLPSKKNLKSENKSTGTGDFLPVPVPVPLYRPVPVPVYRSIPGYRSMKWETGRRQWLFLQPRCYGYVISMVQDNEVGDGTTSVTVFAAELLRVRHIYGTGRDRPVYRYRYRYRPVQGYRYRYRQKSPVPVLLFSDLRFFQW